MRAQSRLALLVELADTLDLGSSSKECGFESRVGHYHFKEVNSMLNKIIKIWKAVGETLVAVAIIIAGIPVLLFWSFIGLGHGLASLINGTD